MPDQEEIAQQQQLLDTYRRRLAYLIQQQAQLGSSTPFSTIEDIRESRTNIRRIKEILRGWGVAVADLPGDEPLESEPLTALDAAQIEQDTTLEVTSDVFIGYALADQAWVRDELVPRLEEAGLKVLVDYRDFEDGASRLDAMEWAVNHSRKTLLVFTPEYLAGEWSDLEKILTQTLLPARQRRKLVPLVLQPCQILTDLHMRPAIDFTQPNDRANQYTVLLRELGTALRSEASNTLTGGVQEVINYVINDRPEGKDQLGYDTYAKAFAQVLSSKNTRTPLTVGIYASWGMGKSFWVSRTCRERP